MSDEDAALTRQDLFDLLSSKDDDFLFRVAREWNWTNGTWLLRWIASQPMCTRATAQLIFWGCEPEAFLPDGPAGAAGSSADDARGRQEESEEYQLAALVLRNWAAGRYLANRPSVVDRVRALVRGRGGRFRADDGTYYAPDQFGYLDPDNPVPRMESYRRAEARCQPAELPWAVPDELGQIQRITRPGYDEDLIEGLPPQFLHLADDDE